MQQLAVPYLAKSALYLKNGMSPEWPCNYSLLSLGGTETNGFLKMFNRRPLTYRFQASVSLDFDASSLEDLHDCV